MTKTKFEIKTTGKNILCFAGDYVEDYEIMVPFQELQLCGYKIKILKKKKKAGETVRKSVNYFDGAQNFREDRGHDFELNGNFDDIQPEDFDALVIPGGRAPEYLRMNKKVVEITTHFLTAADATWKGGDVWAHKNLVTASAWPAHPEWLAAFLELLNTKIVNE